MADDDKNPPVNPAIRVVFKGFVLSHIRPRTSEAWVGSLDSSISTCHRPKITIYKITPSPGDPDHPEQDGHVELICPSVDLNQPFFIDIDPAPQPGGIETFEVQPEPFERLDEIDNHRQDFRWFVDLDKIHPRPISFVDGKVRPKFFIKRGVFHTTLRSDGDTRIGPAHPPDSQTRRFGRFALEIAASIPLYDRETAHILNGTQRVIPDDIVKNSFRYEIVFDCSCQANDDEVESDFNRVYEAITADPPLTPEEKRRFERQHVERLNPEVYCMGGNGGGG